MIFPGPWENAVFFSIVKIGIYIKLIKDHVGILDNLLTDVAAERTQMADIVFKLMYDNAW